MPGAQRKAQLNLIVIVLALAIFAGLAAFLLAVAKTASQDEYLNLYANQLLLSVLRSDTGSPDLNCRTNSDLVACAFLTPAWPCAGTGPSCGPLANSSVSAALQQYDPKLRWLLTVEPEGFVSLQEGEPLRWELGDRTLRTGRDIYAANARIQRPTASGPAILRVQLRIARR